MGILIGCASQRGRALQANRPAAEERSAAPAAASNTADTADTAAKTRPQENPILPASHEAPAELQVEWLVAEVQARNPSLWAVAAAWRAAAARYPQVVSLEDPMFGFMLGPAGLGRDGGWMVMASQKYPWACKRALRGSMAAAEADAAGRDTAEMRLQLAEAAKTAFFDYYLVRRQLEVNSGTADLMRQFREIAKTKYEAKEVSQQDVLQADLDLADLEGRRVELVREEKVAIARINTLLHQAADCPLLPPPQRLDLPDGLPEADALHELAVEQRPDLAAEAARVRAQEAAVALACREYYPDLELVAKYDAFMPEEMRPQIGMNVNVPLRWNRRAAAVEEAQARLQQRRAEYQARWDQIGFEVQSAFERAIGGPLPTVGQFRDNGDVTPAARHES